MRRTYSLNSLVPALALVAGVGVISAGCVVVHDNGPPPPPPTCNIPGPVTYTSSFPAFHVLANASTAIAAGDAGYAVTSNGNGTYRLTYSDTANLATCFTGRITGIDPFSSTQVTGFSGAESIQLIAPNQIGFASVPGAAVDGVDFFAAKDPVYVDVFADGSGSVNIYYTDGVTGTIQTTGANPAAFFSP
jgi:hypothetical protein